MYCCWTQDIIHVTSTRGILDLHLVQNLFATLDQKVFFTCLVNSMDEPGQVESKEGGGGGDEDGGQVELLLPHLQVSMVMAGKV